jgi:hypothetical protein
MPDDVIVPNSDQQSTSDQQPTSKLTYEEMKVIVMRARILSSIVLNIEFLYPSESKEIIEAISKISGDPMVLLPKASLDGLASKYYSLDFNL